MFVAYDPQQAPWRQINSTYGVSCILNFAEGLEPRPEALISGQRAVRQCWQGSPLENFEAGQSVEIHSGPFAIFIATVEQMASDVWAWVLLDFMDKEPCGQVDRK
jgi:transcriptional antiterminator RfaH